MIKYVFVCKIKYNKLTDYHVSQDLEPQAIQHSTK